MVKRIGPSWPRLRRWPVKVATPIKTPRAGAVAVTVPLVLVVLVGHEVGELLAHAGEVIDDGMRLGMPHVPFSVSRFRCPESSYAKTHLREPANRSLSATLEPLGTQDAPNRTTGRDEGDREKRGKTLTPLSTRIASSSRGRAASKQTARGSVVSISSRGRPQISTSRQISTRSQRPRYVLIIWYLDPATTDCGCVTKYFRLRELFGSARDVHGHIPIKGCWPSANHC